MCVCVSERQKNVPFRLLEDEQFHGRSCRVYDKADPVRWGWSYTFNCNFKQGRYVYVWKLQDSKQQQLMTLCEVEINGFILTSSSSIRTPKLAPNSTTSLTTTTTTSITVMIL